MQNVGKDNERSPAPSGKRAERNRHAIVAAARELFIREGFDAGMDLIAAEAGVSKVTVYNHFGSKEELFTEVVGQAMGEAHMTMVEVRTRVAATTDVREALLQTAHALVAAATDPSRLALRNLVTSELRRFPELSQAYQEHGPARSAVALGEMFGDLCERGRLTIADIELAVIQFFSLTIYPHLIVGSIGTSLRPDLADRLITDGVDLFLRQYQPRPAHQPLS
ncbi:TetR/AcrR family transcriptional regulator [Actinomadura rubrisoli]|uniref:TetR/AcrR family transcriptional regulator n=1 Tax=Actinomadura rubrisoli TaxID=2530368 RepID=A0A4R5CHE7_9ACTN|nr:TetR/AcrR family transcriptional regulator [Actinomadura rubrisoli]TDD96712.1 TetR/AcrR family transcriptional regulator [Actinomadura rubrisoli]